MGSTALGGAAPARPGLAYKVTPASPSFFLAFCSFQCTVSSKLCLWRIQKGNDSEFIGSVYLAAIGLFA
jgi:hypothetical protein